MTAAASSHRSAHVLPGFALGVVATAVGLSPWIARGGILPLQNLWEGATADMRMPFVLLPVSQDEATTMFVILVMGGVFAGLARRTFTSHWAAWPIALGALLGQVLAVVQSFAAVATGLDLADQRAALYFSGLLAGAIASVAFAQAGFWLTSRAAVGPASLGIALAAVPFAVWIGAWMSALAGIGGYSQEIGVALRWLPSIVVGLALAWCGVRPPARLIVWVLGLAALWGTPAVFTAVGYVRGSRVIAGDPAIWTDAAMQILPQALQEGMWPVLVALVIGVVGAALRAVLRRPARA